MKHRSVIAFVIVAAALFSLPQLSHDLNELKGEVGARLHRHLLHAFLSLPAGEPVSAAPVARTSDALLASCPTRKSSAPAVKVAKGEAAGRAAAKGFEQSAMVDNPSNDPINQTARVEARREAVKAEAQAGVKVAEVAMIIPPDSRVDPREVAAALKSSDIARLGADRMRAEADGLRVAYAAGARFDAKGVEWKANEEAVRTLSRSLPGGFEFRLVRDGAKTRVLKLKCGECPAAAPRAPRQPQAPAPLPAALTSAEWSAGE